MPRIFKGTETLLKLFVPRVDEGNIETLKIGLFTDDTNNAAEFYGDNMSIDGDTVYLKVNAWSFDTMNDGVLNYIAEIEIGEETIITERQSNYFLKTPNQYVPVGPDLSDFYTKEEIDEMLEDIEVDVDLTGYATEQWVEDKTYATEQWVRRQGYVTDSDVNDYVGNEIGQLEEIINTKQDELISGTNIKTINGNNILGEGDITIEGGSGEQEVYIEEWYDRPTLEQYNRIVELLTSGKVVYHKKDKGIFPLIYSEESVLEKETTMMADNVYKYDVTSTNAVGKGIHYRYDSGFQLRGTNYKIKQPSDSGKGFVRVYHDNKGTSCPISYDATNKIATALVGENIYKWDFVNGENDGFNYFPEIIPITGGGGSGDADLSDYYTKQETDELIANSSVMLETTADGVLTYSQIATLRNNWTNAYIKTHWQENNVTMDKYVAITSLFLNDILGNNKNIHLEGICEGYLYTWDIKGSNTEGTLVRTPISSGGAAKAVVVETEKSGTVYTDILAYSKLAIIQENIGNVYIRGKLNQDSTGINDAVVTNVACHPMFDMLGIGDCKVTAMNANNIYTWTFTNKTTQVSPTITPISEGSTDLSNYYTKEETDNLIANIDIPSGGGSNSIVYHIGTDWDLTEAYNYFNEGKTIILINTDGRVGLVTDVSNTGMIRLNGFLGDLSGDAKPNRFECNNTYNLAEWKIAFHEDIEAIYSMLENGEGGGSGDLSDYYTKSEIDTKLEGVALKSEGNTLGNYILEDTAIVALSTGYLNRQVVEKARNEYKALFVQVAQGNHPSTTKRIPVTIEAHTDSNADITGYTVWGWYSKTQTITWTFSMTNTDVYYTIE